MNEQREIIYAERRRVLDGESMRDVIYKMIADIVDNTVDMVIGEDSDVDEWNFTELNSLLLPIIPLAPVTKERVSKPRKNSLKQQLKEEASKLYENKEAEFPQAEMIRELERVVLLKGDRQQVDVPHRRHGAAAPGHRPAGLRPEGSSGGIQDERL